MTNLNVSQIFLIAAALVLSVACAQKPVVSSLADAPTTDRDRIKAFAGCYKVGFNFAETFALEKGYQTTKPYQAGATEVVIVDKDAPGEVELQHLLVIKGDKEKMALKHWRQEWTYEPTDILDFKGNNTWETRKLSKTEADGRWRQRVTQVDDTPRYECAAPWVETGSGPAWECQSWNPLPRREYTKRSDYQVIERNNVQKLVKDGWIHEQDSNKIKLTATTPETFVKERGENTYTRIPMENCQFAVDWWTGHRDNWSAIRASWAEVRLENPKLKLNFADPEGDLWKKLFALDEKAKGENWDAARVAKESKAVIQTYVVK